MKTVTLEKVVADKGKAPIGAIFTYTYKSLTRDQALQRAAKRLAFEAEDRTHWKLLPDEPLPDPIPGVELELGPEALNSLVQPEERKP